MHLMLPVKRQMYCLSKYSSIEPSPHVNTCKKKPKKKRRRRVDPEEEYDLDDGWIDDSELFYEVTDGGERSAEGPPVGEDWDYGFFAWRGDVQAFLDEPYGPLHCCDPCFVKLMLEYVESSLVRSARGGQKTRSAGHRVLA